MLTYGMWYGFIDDFNIYTTKFEKMGMYSLLSFCSIFTVFLDLITSPFQLIGMIIFLIEKIRKRGK